MKMLWSISTNWCFKNVLVLDWVCTYLDKKRGVQGNTSMSSREFLWAQPEGTSETWSNTPQCMSSIRHTPKTNYIPIAFKIRPFSLNDNKAWKITNILTKRLSSVCQKWCLVRILVFEFFRILLVFMALSYAAIQVFNLAICVLSFSGFLSFVTIWVLSKF